MSELHRSDERASNPGRERRPIANELSALIRENLRALSGGGSA